MIEMESLDKDEGYISPLETLESRGVFSRRKRVTSVSSNSWDRASEAGDDFQNDGGNASFVTEIIRNSSAIIDSLWLTLPESQAYRMTGISEENNLAFESSTIVEVVRSVERVKYISLNEFIRDTVDLLCGKQSHTYILKGGTDFQKQPAVLIHGLTPSAVACYSAQYLPTGSNIVKLSQIDEHFHFQTFVLQSASKVCVSFVKFIKDFLKVYQAIVMLKRGSIKTLTSLRTFFWPYQQQIQTLANIMEEQVFASPVLLLKNLNDFMLKTEVPWVSDMLQNLLISCASAYFGYVSDWIFRGKLHSPLEFHITRNRTAVNQNRKFWTHQFAQNDEIPLFLKKFKNYMFDTGRVVNLMQELETNDLPTCFDHDTDLFIKLKLSHQSIVKLLLAHEAKISTFLQECSYLQAEIEDTVSKTTKMDVQVDQATVDKSASEYFLRHESNKLKRILEEQEIKQTKMASILQEMEDARHARLRQAMDDLFEDKKAKSVGETMEQNQAKREYELTEKYCGQFVSGFSPGEKASIDTLNPVPPTPIQFPHEFVSLAGQIAEHPIAAVNDNKKNCVNSSQLSIPIEGISPVGVLGEHKETAQVILSRREIGAGDNSCDSRAESAFPKEIEIDDFQVKSVKPFQLNLEIFEKAFLPCSTSENGSNSSESPTEECDAFLTNRFLSLSVEIPLMTHHKMVNLALLHHIIVTKQLFRHVKIFQDYILLQNGLFGQFLCGKLIERVKSGILRKKEDIPGQLTVLNQCIEEVLQFTADSDEIVFLDRLKFDRIEEDPSPEKYDSPSKAVPAPSRKKKQTITSEYEVLNSICLRYTVDWPLNIFFTEEFFQKYQNVFTLQMQLYRSEILLEKTAKILKCKATRSSQLNELLYCRYVMLHFVRSLRSYINVTVIHSSWSELTSSFGKMDSVEKIYELLVHHIKTVISNCLLGPKAKSVMKLITSQLTVIESFCAKIETGASSINWAAGGKIPPKEFKILIQTFKVFQEIEKVFVQDRNKATPRYEIREFANELGIQLAENELSKTPQAQFLLEKLQKYLQPLASPAMPTPPTKKKKRYKEPELAQQAFTRSTGDLANGMSFEDVLKVGVRVARSCKPQYIKWLLPKNVEFAKGQLSRGCRPEINQLNFRLTYLKNLLNYINSPFPRFMFLPHEFTSTEIPKNEVIEKVGQLDSEIATMVLKDAEDLSELHMHAKRGAEKIREISRPDEEDDIVGTEERMEQVQKELMQQIKLLLVDMKQEGKIRPRSQDFMTEVIKTGTVPREKAGEVDSHIVSTFVNEMQLLRMRKTGRGKYRLAMIDLNN